MSEQFLAGKKPQIAETILQMFHEAGIKEHEPQLVVQLSDFAYALTKEIVLDAKTLSEFANRRQISREDVDFTINSFQQKHKPQRPSRELLSELAEQKNTQPLQPFRQNFGLRLPNDRFCQVQPNYEYVGVDGTSRDDAMEEGVELPLAKRRPPPDVVPHQFDAKSVSQMLGVRPTDGGSPPGAYGVPMEEDFD